MNAERSSPALWLVLVALASAAAGLAAGWFLRGGTPMPAQPPQLRAPDGVTREQLEELKRDLLAQLERLGRARADGTAPATPDSTVVELGRHIDDLDARIAVLSTGVRPGIGGRAWANARGPGGESIDKIVARIREGNARALNGESSGDVQQSLTREHFLWTLEDVVRAYGPPLHLESTNGLKLFYERFVLEGVSQPCCVEFVVVEGFVTQVDWECRDGL